MIMGTFLAYLSLVLFSFSLDKHFKDAISKNTMKRFKTLLKILAIVLFIFSLYLFIKSVGLSLGITYFLGILSLEIVLIAFIYTYKPEIFIKLTLALFLISLILIFTNF